MNWQYTVRKVVTTPGYTNQTTKAWVAETTTESTITAHVSDITVKELSYLEPRLFNIGDRKLTVESSEGIKVGDRIKISEESTDTEVSEWIVKSKQNSSVLLSKRIGVARDTFYLKRKP